MAEPTRYEIRDAAVERVLRQWADRLRAEVPPGFGFALMVFTLGEHGAMFYISNAQRADMVQAMQEFIRKQADA